MPKKRVQHLHFCFFNMLLALECGICFARSDAGDSDSDSGIRAPSPRLREGRGEREDDLTNVITVHASE